MTTFSLANGGIIRTDTVNSNSAYCDSTVGTNTATCANAACKISNIGINPTSITDVIKKLEEDMKKNYVADTIAVKYIYHSGDATVVYWVDGTKTIVRRSPEEPDSDYTAFCAALAKKLYGSTTNVHSVVMDHLDTTIKAKKEAAKAERRKAQAELEAANHAKKVRAKAKELRLLNEAQMYLAKETAKEALNDGSSN